VATIAATVSVPSSRGKGEEVAGDGISEEGVVKGATLFFCRRHTFFGEVTKRSLRVEVDHFLFWGFSIYGCAFPLEMFNKLLGYEWRTFSGVLVFTRRAINAFFLLNRRSSPSLLLSRELGSVACPSNTARDRKTFTWAAVSQSLYKREKRHFAGSTRWVGQLCISDVSVERMV
jgi:hypothetical protein